MTKLETIERDVQALSREELATFRSWFSEFDAEAWDRQLGADAASGKLDALAGEALKAFRAGRCSEL